MAFGRLDYSGITPVSNSACDHAAAMNTLALSGKTESGSAGTQPDKGYPGLPSGASKVHLTSDGPCRQGPLLLPWDTGAMPQKTLSFMSRCRQDLGLNTQLPDEPSYNNFPGQCQAALLVVMLKDIAVNPRKVGNTFRAALNRNAVKKPDRHLPE